MEAFFVVEWTISETRFHGPFTTKDSAIESAKDTKAGDDEVENIAVIGPIEMTII